MKLFVVNLILVTLAFANLTETSSEKELNQLLPRNIDSEILEDNHGGKLEDDRDAGDPGTTSKEREHFIQCLQVYPEHLCRMMYPTVKYNYNY